MNKIEWSKIQEIINKITRLEIITDKREFMKWNCKIKLDLQDDGKTLKIFVEENNGKF